MIEFIKFTQFDHNGRLRSMIQFLCENCNNETIQRLEEVKRRGYLCKSCKLKQNSQNEFYHKDLELTCAKVLKSRMNKRYNKRGLGCTLSGEEILSLVKSKCHYCGSKNSNHFKYKQPNFEYNFYYNGIDRIDSSIGYIQGNVVSCCKTCNIAKMDMNYNDFINHIKKIYNNLRNAGI
jgi:hypothetical protein